MAPRFGAVSVGAELLALGVLPTVLAWLVARPFGPPGWLLRLPLLRGILVAAGGCLLSLRPGFFPVEHAARERAFCGVRP
jgi:hypothetical protein